MSQSNGEIDYSVTMKAVGNMHGFITRQEEGSRSFSGRGGLGRIPEACYGVGAGLSQGEETRSADAPSRACGGRR